ncbi:hypothetical protein ACT3SZ_09205 [Corynebacterium sp. AOP40-9SA-29]|uniref:hypothetical protein n=1 Tax=Corynebacterium sp. AOP40-9SA-29 TaxID=3457677 RepID=UPI004034DF87
MPSPQRKCAIQLEPLLGTLAAKLTDRGGNDAGKDGRDSVDIAGHSDGAAP